MTDRLAAGDTAPDFTLPDQDGVEHSLAALRGKKVIVYFYPAASTPGCTTEACDFRDNMSSLQAAGYEVLGVSKDEQAKLKTFQHEQALTFPLLSDPDLAVHKAYAAWGEKNNYGKIVTGTIRSTIVVDEDGTVQLPLYNVKATGHVASLRKKLGGGCGPGHALAPRCGSRDPPPGLQCAVCRPPSQARPALAPRAAGASPRAGRALIGRTRERGRHRPRQHERDAEQCGDQQDPTDRRLTEDALERTDRDGALQHLPDDDPRAHPRAPLPQAVQQRTEPERRDGRQDRQGDPGGQARRRCDDQLDDEHDGDHDERRELEADHHQQADQGA
jgi:peroxiredoxin Q/BCP